MLENRKFKILLLLVGYLIFNVVCDAHACEGKGNTMEIVEKLNEIDKNNQKTAYLTFDDGPSIYTGKLLDVLNEHDIPGIFFVLGNQLNYVPDADQLLNRMVKEGHHIALHTVTHDKSVLYHSEKSPTNFTEEMLALKEDITKRTGHITNLCRAPYGKKGHFKPAHYQTVENAGLYCIDWHVDSNDWAAKNATEVYDEVVKQLEKYENAQEVVLLFHEYQHTVDALPDVIAYLKAQGFQFEAYVEGKKFKGLS